MSTINKIKTLLGMEVKLEQMKLADGMTVLEADAFESEMEVFVLTEDEQKIPVPVGEYEMEDGRILVVVSEGLISEVKEKMEEEEEEAVVEEEVAAEVAPVTPASTSPKKTIESVTKESFFSEIEELKAEIVELKAQIELSKVVVEEEVVELAEEPKPISFNPENVSNTSTMLYGQNRPRTMMDSILAKMNK
jgi:hypothetical protein